MWASPREHVVIIRLAVDNVLLSMFPNEFSKPAFQHSINGKSNVDVQWSYVGILHTLSMWLWSQLLSHASWGITRILSDMCSVPLLDPVPWYSSQFYFCSGFEFFEFFKGVDSVFHKVRKAVARIVAPQPWSVTYFTLSHMLYRNL